VTGAVAGVTADVTGVAAGVTGAGLAGAGLAGAGLGVLVGGGAGGWQVAAGEPGGVAGVAQVAAGGPGGAAAGGEVAAWAWREDTSRMARIPAARIAVCIAR
jgi:hypothetical protein